MRLFIPDRARIQLRHSDPARWVLLQRLIRLQQRHHEIQVAIMPPSRSHVWMRNTVFAKWADDGSLEQAFIASVRHLAEHHQLDLNILHGDGTNTVAKKGGDGIGYSGHKHQRGEKIIAIVDNNEFVLASGGTGE